MLNLLEGINIALKWDLDSIRLSLAESVTCLPRLYKVCKYLRLCIADRRKQQHEATHQAFTDMGINTVAMDNGGWAISRTSVESVLAKLAQQTRQSQWSYTALIIQVSR